MTTPKPSESKPLDLSSPSVLENTELVTSEKVLGFVPTAAHVILRYAFLYCKIEKITILKLVPPVSVSLYFPSATYTAIPSRGFHS